MSVPNVLATRYASPAMRALWSPEAKIVAERRLWLAVLEAQRDLGVDVDAVAGAGAAFVVVVGVAAAEAAGEVGAAGACRST